MQTGKHLHIEKPHVVTDDQLDRLLEAKKRHLASLISLGFNRQNSQYFQRVRTQISSQSGPIMINWFIAGRKIPEDQWYFKEEEGGRVLDNLCHCTDLTLEIVGVENAFPCEITPASHRGSKSDFCVGIRFANDSVAGIPFSAKGPHSTGSGRCCRPHRSEVLVRLRAFEETMIEIVEKRQRLKTSHCNHGHNANIMNSYEGVRQILDANATDVRYLEATSQLFLDVRQAIDDLVTATIDLA